MHSAIIYAVMPPGQQQFSDEAMWLRTAVKDAEKLAKPLGEFVWEVNFREAPQALGLLVHALEQRKLPYAILPIADVPQWIRHDPPQSGAQS